MEKDEEATRQASDEFLTKMKIDQTIIRSSCFLDMGLFSRTSPKEKLQKKYKQLMEEAFKLSTLDRSKSDGKYAEAEQVMKQIEALG